MKTKIKDLDDVVFEERNQNYGAYYLRKNYYKNVSRALFIAIVFLSGITSIPLIAGYFKNTIDKKIGTDVLWEPLPVPKKDIVDVKLPEPLPVEKKVEVFKPPQVVVEEVVESDIDIMGLMENTQNYSPTEIGNGNIIINEDSKVKEIIDLNDDKIFVSTDILPEFVGGIEALYKWLYDNTKYPQLARETGISGTVYVSFVIEKDGSVTDINLMNNIGGGCGEEALRVINLMPKWKAGRQNNRPVRVKLNLPIKFMFND
ncbi:MAG: energy transducer TonB [Bacteroidetes bacterium]|nr:energy transducer TonB [Bacteroidota bacterium]